MGIQRGGAADDDEEHDHHAGDAADENVHARVLVLARPDALFDEARLQIEKLPGSDGGADQPDEHQQIGRVQVNVGNNGRLGGDEPIRLGEKGRNHVGEIKRAGDQKNLFHLAIVAAHNQHPNGDGGQRHGNVFADAEDLHRGGHAGEFRDRVAQVHQEGGDHDEERGAEAELLADQVGEAFAGDHAHAGAHLLADVEGDGHGNERPEQRVAELCAGRGVHGDAAGVVVHVGGDDARTDDGQKTARRRRTGRVRRLKSLARPASREKVSVNVIQVFMVMQIRGLKPELNRNLFLG